MFNVFIVPIALYGVETWTLTKAELSILKSKFIELLRIALRMPLKPNTPQVAEATGKTWGGPPNEQVLKKARRAGVGELVSIMRKRWVALHTRLCYTKVGAEAVKLMEDQGTQGFIADNGP